MKNTTKILIFIILTCMGLTQTPMNTKGYLFWMFLMGILLSMYRYFILKDVVYEDEKTMRVINYIENKRDIDG